MKRVGNLFHEITDIKNIEKADISARKDKGFRKEIAEYDLERDENHKKLSQSLEDGTYRCSPYREKEILDPKRRLLKIPPYGDRVLDHAIVNVTEPYFLRQFTKDTCSCLKGIGIKGAIERIDYIMKDKRGSKYVLVEDVHHYYDSIDHEILKKLLRRIFKDNQLLWLLDMIIDSIDGLPIGRFLSQYLANFYLSPSDHWMKEVKKVKHYVRYMDNMVTFGSSAKKLRQLHYERVEYFRDNLHLEFNSSWQIFEIGECKGKGRGLDFVGIVFYRNGSMLRKRIKKNLANKVAKLNKYEHLSEKQWRKRTGAWWGWLLAVNGRNLTNKFGLYEKYESKLKMKKFSELGIKAGLTTIEGENISIKDLVGKKFVITDYTSVTVGGMNKALVGIEYEGRKRRFFTASHTVIEQMSVVQKSDMPIEATIVSIETKRGPMYSIGDPE